MWSVCFAAALQSEMALGQKNWNLWFSGSTIIIAAQVGVVMIRLKISDTRYLS